MAAGASVKAKDNAGMTPMDLARDNDDPEVLEALSARYPKRGKAAKKNQAKLIPEEQGDQRRGRGLPPMLGEDRRELAELIDL